jgi:hypothetical protein
MRAASEIEPRKPGRLKDRIHISEDFDASLPTEIAEGSGGERE